MTTNRGGASTIANYTKKVGLVDRWVELLLSGKTCKYIMRSTDDKDQLFALLNRICRERHQGIELVFTNDPDQTNSFLISLKAA